MNVLVGIALALRALWRKPLRAALTITGLLIGVAAVMMVTGLSSGARTFIGRRLEQMGTSIVVVLPQTALSGARSGSQPRLTEEDVQAVAREAASVTKAAPIISTRATATYGDRSVTTDLYGTTEDFFSIRNWPMLRGQVWSPTDELTKAKVCVVGTTVARQLFASEDPVGRTIRVGRHPYRITGVLASKGQDVQSNDMDDRIVMPIGSARMRFLNGASKRVDVLIASAASPRSAARAALQVESIIRQRHRTTAREADFTVLSQERLLEVQSLVFDSLTGFLVCVAAVSLLVGGIGVMNIMLVSVTERTREIGIRLAIGATRADVLMQFLVESAVVALLGGALGVLVGAGGVAAFGSLLGWPMEVGAPAIVAGVTVSALTGIAFGFAPARRASRLDPIDALRHE